jgi:hypothetical protein
MEVQGIIKNIGETKTFGESFNKRELWLVTQEDYPQTLNLEFVQDKTKLLDYYSKGDSVKVNINLRGRAFTGADGIEKVFNSIQGWRIEKLAAEAPQSEEVDDMPF